jgi:hypothetical protein
VHEGSADAGEGACPLRESAVADFFVALAALPLRVVWHRATWDSDSAYTSFARPR